MKKLIAMIAAAVMGFAYGDGLKNTTGFEGENLAGTVLDTTKDDTGGDSGSKFWFAGAEELGTITAYDTAAKYGYTEGERIAGDTDTAPGLNFLALDSGSTVLYRTISANTGTLPEATDINDGLFFDSLVKFTVTEYDPTAAITVDEGTKLAVWLGQAESDEGDAPTNLIVTAAIWDAAAKGGEGGYVATNFVASVANVDLTDGAWHRVTARAIKQVTTTAADRIAGFTLFIDTVPVTYDVNPFAPGAVQTAEAGILLGNGALFLNLMSGSTAVADLVGFGFKGTGSIDDVSITDKDNAPVFAKGQKVLNLTWDANVASIKLNNEEIIETPGEAGSKNDIMLDNAENTFVFTYATGYMAGNNVFTDCTYLNGTLTIPAAGEVSLEGVPVACTFGGENYASLAEAWTAAMTAKSGTIKLAGGAIAGGAATLAIEDADVDIVLDLASSTLTFADFKQPAAFYATAGKLTVIDSVGGGKVVVTLAQDYEDFTGAFVAYNDGDETFGTILIGAATGDEGVTIDALVGEGNGLKLVKGDFAKATNTDAATLKALLADKDNFDITSKNDNYWTVSAAEPAKPFKGAGTEDDPFQIWNVADLNKFNELVGKADADYIAACYILMDNIDMDGVEWTAPCPKGAAHGTAGAFQGVFDGNGKEISNLKPMIVNDAYCGGLVNTADGAVFKNLTMEIDGFGNTVGTQKFGGIVACAADTLISNCVMKGEITVNHNSGAFVEFSQHADATYPITFVDCVNEMNVTLTGAKSAGGFIGKSQGQIINMIRCVNKGAITRTAGTVGGFCGDGSQLNYVDCVNEGTVTTGYGQFGAAVSVGGEMKCADDALAFTGAIDGGNFADKAAIVDNVATLISNDQVVVGGEYKVMSKIGTLPVTFTEAKQTIAFDVALNTAFAATITADGVGVETNLVDTLLTYTAIELPPFLGSGTEDDPFQIWNVADLNKFNELVGKADADYIAACYILMDNIDMDGVEWTAPCPKGAAHGNAGAFQGVFDGNGKEISNLKPMIVNDAYCGGLVNTADGAVFKNLTMEIDGFGNTVGTQKFGGIVACAADTLISNCVMKGEITVNHNSGAFVEFSQHADATYPITFVDCVNEMNVTLTGSKSAGGFIGKSQGQIIYMIRCVNKGTITRTAGTVGGFCGDGSQLNYVDCVNEGAVTTGYGQFGAAVSVGGEMKCADDALAFTGAIDGGNFADKAAIVEGVATLISNDQVVVGGTYKVMSKIATLPVTLDTVGQTIAFDVALNSAFAADITATGVGVETNLVENVLTYTAIEAPTPGEDWPTDPTVDEGKDAKETFPNLPAAFEGADAGLVAAWAKKTGLAYADMADANIDAFLLDCTPAQVETEAAKFKIISIENINGEWVVKVTGEKIEGENYTVNAKVDIVDVTDEFDEALEEKSDAKGFFKAKLVPFIITK